MRPSKAFDHADREIIREDFSVGGIGVRDSRDAAEEILQSAPREPHRLGNRELLFHGRTIRVIDVLSPSGCVWIRTPAKAREQIKFQMVVELISPGRIRWPERSR